MVQWFVTAKWSRRIGVTGMAVVLASGLTGCQARGGGSIGAPLPGTVAAQSSYAEEATFGFTFTCEMRNGKAVVRGELSYHDHAPSSVRGLSFPEIALHGTTDPILMDASSCDAAADLLGGSGSDAQFTGTYQAQALDPILLDTLSEGLFKVDVFDQGEPGRSKGEITGDGFSIELTGGRYSGYTRAGYIEGGNIQVE